MKLTEKQKRALDYITEYMHEHGYAPSFRELSQNFGISVGAGQQYLTALKKKGYIDIVPGIARSIVVKKSA